MGLTGAMFKVSQHHHQVTYQTTHLATLIKKKITQCNLFYLLLPYMMKHVSRKTQFDGMIYAQVTLHGEVSHTEVSHRCQSMFSDMPVLSYELSAVPSALFNKYGGHAIILQGNAEKQTPG